jgi:hypothetical protein
MTVLDLRSLARALGGDINSGQVLAPGPGHSAADRSLSVKPDPGAPDGFIVHSFAGDDAITCKDYVREKMGLEAQRRLDLEREGLPARRLSLAGLAEIS